MGFLKGVLWVLGAVALLAVAMYATDNFALADYLTTAFLLIQPSLPITLSFDQFLVAATLLSLVAALVVFLACAGLVAFMAARLSAARVRQSGAAAASQRELRHVQEQHLRQYEQLLTLGRGLTQRLDKRVLVQGIVEAASRITSVPRTDSLVSLWLLRFETDTMRFETGMYCDAAMFQQSEYPLTDSTFAQVVATQSPWVLSAWWERLACVRPDRHQQTGEATAGLVIPLMVENSVLGVLIILCHPDVVKSYEAQRAFYDAMWGELSLALAVAVQGELAILDRLTGVHNREYFMKRFVQEIERANRYQFPLSLLMVDIDNFKQVNDTLGHPQGDAVLKIIARIIRQEVRAIDLVGRYGGEEFIILLPETGLGEEGTSASGALVVAERIRKAIEAEFYGMRKPLGLTVSLGVGVRRFPQDRGMDHKELLRLTDEQLYRAKTTGKNKVCVLSHEPSQPAS